MRKWLGQERFRRELEELTGAVYVVIEETGQEAAVIEETLREMADGLPPEVADWYCIPEWKEKNQFSRICLPRGEGCVWEQDLKELVLRAEKLFEEQWEKEDGKTDWEAWREDTAAQLLGPFNQYWSSPELVVYQTGLVEKLLEELLSLEEFDFIDWMPAPLQRAKEKPVVRGDMLSRAVLAGHFEYRGSSRWKPGLMQEASGGYLLLSAEELTASPGAWRCLRDAMLREELPGPGALPFRVQVILFGTAELYGALKEMEGDFGFLFGQTICLPSFAEDKDASRKAWDTYLRGICAEKGLDMGNITEAVLEELGRGYGIRGSIPCCFGLSRPIMERGFLYCCQEGKDCLDAEIIEKVLKYRRDKRREQTWQAFELNRARLEEIPERGEAIGAVNGLAVSDMGYFRMAQPIQITAQYRAKRIYIESAERKTGLAGRIFNKGLEILGGYLGGLNHQRHREILLSCEQSYVPIEGDSALLAQTYAILSLLSKTPISSNIAVTGSLNASGRILPVGGITEKIEGFFDFCRWKKKDITVKKEDDNTGVLFPAANLPDLRLSADIQKAVDDGEFCLYPIEYLEEGIPILTGNPAAGVLHRAGRRL